MVALGEVHPGGMLLSRGVCHRHGDRDRLSRTLSSKLPSGLDSCPVPRAVFGLKTGLVDDGAASSIGGMWCGIHPARSGAHGHPVISTPTPAPRGAHPLLGGARRGVVQWDPHPATWGHQTPILVPQGGLGPSGDPLRHLVTPSLLCAAGRGIWGFWGCFSDISNLCSTVPCSSLRGGLKRGEGVGGGLHWPHANPGGCNSGLGEVRSPSSRDEHHPPHTPSWRPRSQSGDKFVPDQLLRRGRYSGWGFYSRPPATAWAAGGWSWGRIRPLAGRWQVLGPPAGPGTPGRSRTSPPGALWRRALRGWGCPGRGLGRAGGSN